MDLIWNAAASSCWASVSILPNTTSSWVSAAFSNTGAKTRQGPHQSAQTSSSTMSFPSMVLLTLSVVISVVAMLQDTPWGYLQCVLRPKPAANQATVGA